MQNPNTGRFITIEGGEGVGKSRFADELAKALTSSSIDLVRTYEPGGTPSAQKLRELFLNPPKEDPLLIETEFCIVSAARVQHVGRKILPALKAGKWVLCDRFADSARVYQGMLAGLDEASLEAIIRFTTFGLEPDITFVLDCDVGISLKRMGERAQKPASDGGNAENRFDKNGADFHEKIRRCFWALQKKFPHRIVLLDAARTPGEVAAQAMATIKAKFS